VWSILDFQEVQVAAEIQSTQLDSISDGIGIRRCGLCCGRPVPHKPEKDSLVIHVPTTIHMSEIEGLQVQYTLGTGWPMGLGSGWILSDNVEKGYAPPPVLPTFSLHDRQNVQT
jgi:hypothetical protein